MAFLYGGDGAKSSHKIFPETLLTYDNNTFLQFTIVKIL